MNERDLSRIPASACTFEIADPEVGDNGEGAKTAPVRLVARSGKPIEHYYWGRVVHDMAGMHLSKPRIPIDYCHDTGDVIGFLNRFNTESGDLVVTGALVPFKSSDRATEIMHKMKNGVPYEASINFGGDGIKVQEIAEGEVAEVNGARFDGPGIVIREWPLRGVAICPYGADGNTESAVLSDKKRTFTASVFKAEPQATTEEPAMDKPVDVEAQAEAPKADETTLTQTVEAPPTESATPEAELAAPAVDVVEPVEVPPAEVAPQEAPPENAQFSQAEFIRIADKFGADIAARAVREGADYAAAVEWAYEGATTKAEALAKQLSEINTQSNGTPVPVTEAKPTAGLFKSSK